MMQRLMGNQDELNQHFNFRVCLLPLGDYTLDCEIGGVEDDNVSIYI